MLSSQRARRCRPSFPSNSGESQPPIKCQTMTPIDQADAMLDWRRPVRAACIGARLEPTGQQLPETVEPSNVPGERVALRERHPPKVSVDFPQKLDVDAFANVPKIDEQTESQRDLLASHRIGIPIGNALPHRHSSAKHIEKTIQVSFGHRTQLASFCGRGGNSAPGAPPKRVVRLTGNGRCIKQALALCERAQDGGGPVRHLLPIDAAESTDEPCQALRDQGHHLPRVSDTGNLRSRRPKPLMRPPSPTIPVYIAV